jgi:hypothetical protein
MGKFFYHPYFSMESPSLSFPLIHEKNKKIGTCLNICVYTNTYIHLENIQ